MGGDFEFWHERLDVYRRALKFAAVADEMLCELDVPIAAVDHLFRASESIAENIVTGNASWSAEIKRHHLAIACGSALECAGCLDICCVRKVIDGKACRVQKLEIRRIVQMLVGLIRTRSDKVMESTDRKSASEMRGDILFDHERLDLYQQALEFVRWFDAVVQSHALPIRRVKRLDALSPSIVLNIAEGNGRFDSADHRQFIQIAHQSALKSAVAIDLMVSKREINGGPARDAKRMLRRIAQMLVGMRGYLTENA